MDTDTGLLIGFLGAYFFFVLIVMAIMVVSMWKVFDKAGEPGWAAIIPVYNYIVILTIAGKPWWWLLLLLIPLVNIVLAFIVYIEFAKSFGKGGAFAAGLIFLGIIFFPILAFGDARYVGPGGRPVVRPAV
jgi:hypothetical protein